MLVHQRRDAGSGGHIRPTGAHAGLVEAVHVGARPPIHGLLHFRSDMMTDFGAGGVS